MPRSDQSPGVPGSRPRELVQVQDSVDVECDDRASGLCRPRWSLDRRIEDLDVFNAELTACQNPTNASQRQVSWHFTTSDARTRLRHLHPER
jgi:hypothetical protein